MGSSIVDQCICCTTSPSCQGLKLFLALVLGILLLPLIILALVFLFLSLVLLFPAYCIFLLALMLFKIIFKCHTKTRQNIDVHQGLQELQQVCQETDSSELSFDPPESEDSKNEIAEAQNLSRHLELWHNWNPESVEIHERKPFNELMSFWRSQEKLAAKQR